MTDKLDLPKNIEEMAKVGAHFGFLRSRRHPSFKNYICGVKNMTEIIDLEQTDTMLAKAEEFMSTLGKANKTILMISSKSEAKEIIRRIAEGAGIPYVAGRWIGGVFTNFPEIKKRVARLADLVGKKERGELMKYTKKERLMFDREIEHLTNLFFGLKGLEKIPDALFVVDPKKEHIAVAEAHKMKIPVVALASTDCDLSLVNYAIPGNDGSRASIEYFVKRIIDSYKRA